MSGPVLFAPRRAPRLAQVESLAEVLRREGAVVSVQVQIPSSLAAQMQAQGQTVPPPQVVKGIVDTGASISTVSDAVAQAAGLKQVGTVPLYGVGGGGEKPVFAASFGMPDYGATVDPIEVGGVTIGMPGVDILIGRDILKALDLFEYRGPQGVFSITQGQPGQAVPGAPAAPSGGGLSTTEWLGIGAGAAALVGLGLVAFDVL